MEQYTNSMVCLFLSSTLRIRQKTKETALDFVSELKRYFRTMVLVDMKVSVMLISFFLWINYEVSMFKFRWSNLYDKLRLSKYQSS